MADWNKASATKRNAGDRAFFEGSGDNQADGFGDADPFGGRNGFTENQCGGGLSGECFNSGQIGHNRTDCTESRVFKGECRHCGKEGHLVKDCPDRPSSICKKCKQEGHNTSECTNDRVIDDEDVPTMKPEKAWELVEQASKERDLDDLRDALKAYAKAVKKVNYVELEKSFRANNLNFYIIAMEKDLADTFTLMNLQGKTGMKYTVGYFLGPHAPRATLQHGWPKSAEENMARLETAGYPVQSFILKCRNCGEVGHAAKACKEEKVEPTHKVEVRCYNCDEIGHRPRDCPKPRIDKFACRNCGRRGHNSKECPEPRNPENVQCKNCEKMGHFSRECPERELETCHNCGVTGHRARECGQPRNPATMQCRNCDGMGHSSRECTKKKDWSRVKCQNCGEMGHGKARCTQPAAEDGAGGGGGDFGDGGFGGGDWNGDADVPPAPDTNAPDEDW